MKRAFCPTIAMVLSSILVMPAASRAADSPLSIIPADAIGFVCVQNLKQLDDNAAAILQELGLAPMIPPGFRSLITMLKEYGPLGDGLNESGSLAVVMLGAETPDQMWDPSRSGLIISATDPKALLESLNPEPAEDGTSLVTLFGKPSYAITKQNALVIAPIPAAAKALAKESAGIDTKLKPAEVKALAELDLAFWVNASEGFKLAKPMIDGFTTGFKAMSGAEEGSLKAIQAQGLIDSIEMMREGAETISGGLSLGQGGLGLRFTVLMKPGSELAKMSGTHLATESSLLAGLPDEDFILALGQVANPEQAKEGMKMVTNYLQANEVKEALGDEAAKKLQTDLESLMGLTRGLALSISILPPGPDGLVGIASVWKVSDAKNWVDKVAAIVETAKGVTVEDEQIQAMLGAISYKSEAQTVAGVSVSHLSFDVEKAAELDADEMDKIGKILGRDGLLIRIAPVDGKHVAIGFGGGEARFVKIIEAAKAGKAPLQATTGIKRVSRNLPKAKISEIYLAVDRILALVRNVNEAVGEAGGFPFTMAAVNAPIAVTSSGDEMSLVVDVFLPMELIVELKNVAMQAMGQMMAGGMRPGQPGPMTDDDMSDDSDTEDQGEDQDQDEGKQDRPDE